jgi:hypothetical protein
MVILSASMWPSTAARARPHDRIACGINWPESLEMRLLWRQAVFRPACHAGNVSRQHRSSALTQCDR